MNGNIPRMDYRQYRAARRLVHECCNYDSGNCLLLEDGEPCVCVQSISYSLLCRWFTAAVLPLDEALEAALLRRGSRKRCAVCGAFFFPKSNRGKYCPDCAGRMKRLAAEGQPVKQTKFETDKAKLRQTIRNAMSEATTFDEFSALLLRQGVIVKESRGRLSYLTPDRTKPITARKLGDDFDRAAVLALLEQNTHRAAEKTAPIPEYHTAETNRTERGKTQKIAPTGNIQRMVDRAAKRAEGKGIGYDRWAAVHNLKQMAATVAAMEQYGFTPDELDAALVSANADLHSSTAKLKPIETAIREKKDLQKQVLAYAKTRDVRDGLKKQKTDKARKAYREKHESDFIIADAAVRYFRQKGITKLPTYKSLQAEIEQLTAEKNALYNEYRANKERVLELQTMKSNLSQMHHGEPSRQKKHEQER